MNELLYNQSSILISAVLLVSMMAMIEVGYRLGCRRRAGANEAIKEQTSAIQNSILGILALMLGFTFSLSLQRYDQRSEAVVHEANAIGTTWLRTQLLPESARPEAQELLRKYLDVRIQANEITIAKEAQRAPLLEQANQTNDRLWAVATRAAAQEPNPVTTGLFIQSLNEMIDANSSLDAALHRHVPELVSFLLYITFLLAGWILGLTAGLSGHRPAGATHILLCLIVMLVFVIIDLDRPRRGLIQVSQKNMLDLQASISISRK